MTVVVTLWILTSYLMLQVPSVLRWTILSHHHLVESNPWQFEALSSNYNIEKISSTATRGIFSIFSVWHRLTTLFDAEDDPRVPAFQVNVFIIINQIFFSGTSQCKSNNILIINDSDIHINDYWWKLFRLTSTPMIIFILIIVFYQYLHFEHSQTYIHMAAYIFTILWGIIRPAVCFKYSPKIRRALGPWAT